jgi:D-aminoacyl-tRNA deacylase
MVRFVIVATEKDLASKNIANKLIELGNFEKSEEKHFQTLRRGEDILIWHPEELIFATDLSEHYQPECFIFLFRHLSKNNDASLSVHVTGNLTSEVKRAGNPYELGIANPTYMLSVLKGLSKYAPEGYKISYEATHHSPTNLTKPLMFVEIGSTEKEWNDEKAIEAVAKSILDFLDNSAQNCVSCIGLGGSHYAERFTRKSLESNYAFGHIIPNYEFSKITKDVIQQAIDKTIGIKKAVFDSRSQGKEEERKSILEVLEKNNIEVEKLK